VILVELRIAYRELVRAGSVALPQARLADGVRHVDEVQPVPSTRLLE